MNHRVFISDEIHLKWSHFDNGGYLGNYRIDKTRCGYCDYILPYVGFFVKNRYVCLRCLIHKLLPKFCSERFLLLRSSEFVPPDIALVIVKKIVLLSFDLKQIDEMSVLKRHCDIYQCCTPENVKALIDMKARIMNIYSVDK